MRLPRACGCLLHPTSLPGPFGSGDLGREARRFVDWLQASGQRVWQVLPLGGIGRGNSPYMSTSAFAGNPLLIDLVELQQRGWLEATELQAAAELPARRIDFTAVIEFRLRLLALAARRFDADGAQRGAFEDFCNRHAGWLDDYALFMALSEKYPGREWCDWHEPLAAREPAALAQARERLADRIGWWKFCQWCFFRQWRELRDYANQRDVRIMGDAPIFVAYHSADVWSQRGLFELDRRGRPEAVAGVPPDYYSESGQLWGNPLYRWSTHRQQGFDWWIARVRHSFELYDVLRIDHFLGFINYWEIPSSATSAVEGRWLPGPGASLFDALGEALGDVVIVAEDLGSVTPAVAELRRRFDIPGMAVLQFAWESGADNPHMPHNHEQNSVVYSGTHDNDTTLGWWASRNQDQRRVVREYLASDCSQPHRDLIRCAFESRADTAIIPLQDYLGLGSGHRMNTPGEAEGNWGWRFLWSDIDPGLAAEIATLARDCGRLSD